MRRVVRVAACSLNQWSLDFGGNARRLAHSVRRCKRSGATVRVGCELELSGYGCEDHFHEPDTYEHTVDALATLLEDRSLDGVLIITGGPMLHKGVSYNCALAVHNGRVLLVRPKSVLCDSGNYRERRWFAAWPPAAPVEQYALPHRLVQASAGGQRWCPFGDALLVSSDGCSLGVEICEELWSPQHATAAMPPRLTDGCDVLCNTSAGHYTIGRRSDAQQLVMSSTLRCGGAYVYANERGCDGGRLLMEGEAMVAVNGRMLAAARPFTLRQCELAVADIDLGDVFAYRQLMRKGVARPAASGRHSIAVDEWQALLPPHCAPIGGGESPHEMHCAAAEPTDRDVLPSAMALYLWDYLRRSRQAGYLVPLSGGADSAAVACLVFHMCHMVAQFVNDEREDATDRDEVLRELRTVLANGDFTPQDGGHLCNKLLSTYYMASAHSSADTKRRADNLALAINSNHRCLEIDGAVAAACRTVEQCLGTRPQFAAAGGTPVEDLALQNVQARMRMVLSYMLGQLGPLADSGGAQHRSLLVLATGNLDEGLRGYATKYDCSSGDLAPIACLSKRHVRHLLQSIGKAHGLHTAVGDIVHAVPTAELVPLAEGGQCVQTDEDDMGLTYDELSILGTLRKVHACGPYSAYTKLKSGAWRGRAPSGVAAKVKHFYRMYSINRHKATVAPPAIHLEPYSADDNRFDHRPFLYNTDWLWQFRKIDCDVEASGEHGATAP